MDQTALATRNGLPDALRVLLTDFPREGWERDPHFTGLVQFWLERHMMFRRILQEMTGLSQSLLDRRIEGAPFAARLSRYGGMFVEQLHGHHTIEDTQYFPRIAKLDPRIEGGFAILDRDHHAIDGHLNGFVEVANDTLITRDDADALHRETGKLLTTLDGLTALLNRHLIDEEELVVPVILKYGDPHG